jgi:hypothetical protein
VNKLIIAVAVITSALVVACNPPKVVQGTVLAVSDDGTTLTLQDELPPNQELVVSTKGAEVGAAPVAGDIVRIAYYPRGKELIATRIMNLTRQPEFAKKH